MLDIQFDTAEFKALEKRLSRMGKYITERDYDTIMRRALKPVKEQIFTLQPKSINNSRYSYSSAQINIQNYGLLEKALGVSKQRKKAEFGEHSFFVGYDSRRGKKAFVSVFLNYGTGSPNFLSRIGFLQTAERTTLGEVQRIFLDGMQGKFDEILHQFT